MDTHLQDTLAHKKNEAFWNTETILEWKINIFMER